MIIIIIIIIPTCAIFVINIYIYIVNFNRSKVEMTSRSTIPPRKYRAFDD